MASKFKRAAIALVLCALNLEMLTSNAYLQGRPADQRRPVKRAESRDQWYADGQRAVEAAKQLKANRGQARNVILFVGDGMGISTVTAARILEGQLRGESGEENSLSFERLPFVALSKTYSVNQQTSDSAPTMTAIVTGVKTDDGVISVDQDVVSGDHTTVKGNELPTFLELAEQAGLSTGVVSTARITHATPAACYAHSPDRDWEGDADLPEAARENGFPDIARQLVELPHGNGLEVVLGGGRGNPADDFEKDKLGRPFTTLGYANGPGYPGPSKEQTEGPKRHPHPGNGYSGVSKGRPDLSTLVTTDPDYLQEAAIPFASETHGGEDVAIYASGPGAYLFHGVQEQNVIFHVMVEAMKLPRKNPSRITTHSRMDQKK